MEEKVELVWLDIIFMFIFFLNIILSIVFLNLIGIIIIGGSLYYFWVYPYAWKKMSLGNRLLISFAVAAILVVGSFAPILLHMDYEILGGMLVYILPAIIGTYIFLSGANVFILLLQKKHKVGGDGTTLLEHVFGGEEEAKENK